MRKTKTISTDPGNTRVEASMSHAQFERLDHGDPKFDPLRKRDSIAARIATPIAKLRTKS